MHPNPSMKLGTSFPFLSLNAHSGWPVYGLCLTVDSFHGSGWELNPKEEPKSF